MGEAGFFAFWLAVGLVGLGLFFGPIGSAFGRWIESRTGGAAGGDPELLRQLESRLAELEGVERRVLELEERLDFAERLLTQARLAAPRDADTPPEPVESPR